MRDAVAGGADGLAMAGGDGSQAVVAAIAAELDLPYACIPAGTRNHFALDLGVDRDDVVGALDAFVDGGERRVDLAEVNGRVFVNNVSLGLYAEAVQREGYRDAKLRTLLDTVPDVLGPDGDGLDLRWTGPGGHEHASGAAILVSNNRYRLGRAVGSGTRPRIDDGLLGDHGRRRPDRPRRAAAAAAATVAGVDGAGASRSTPTSPVPAGIDGEARAARAAAALPHPRPACCACGSRAGIPAPRRRRCCPRASGERPRAGPDRRRARARQPADPSTRRRRPDGHLRGRAEGAPEPRGGRRPAAQPRRHARPPQRHRVRARRHAASRSTSPDEVDLKLELEVESDERELEIELKW